MQVMVLCSLLFFLWLREVLAWPSIDRSCAGRRSDLHNALFDARLLTDFAAETFESYINRKHSLDRRTISVVQNTTLAVFGYKLPHESGILDYLSGMISGLLMDSLIPHHQRRLAAGY